MFFMAFRRMAAFVSCVALSCGVIALAQSAPGSYVIGAQDVLAITVYEQPDIAGKYTVESDGTFTFWQIGRIKAKGLTLREFEAELVRRLKDGYFVDPHVSVSIDQYKSQRVVVMGEVRAPGTYPVTGGMSLVEALATAGGTLPTAAGEVRIIHRSATAKRADGADPKDDTDVVIVNLRALQDGTAARVDLADGDTITVPRAESIYVFGEVKNPGAYAVQQQTTVLQALSLAGGSTPSAAISRIKIVRMERGQKKEIKVKLTDIVKPGDTIIVPERYF